MFKLTLCWLLITSLMMAPALAAMEYSGNQSAARQEQPLLKALICSPALFGGIGSDCALDAVRIIGDWAWVSWSGNAAAGMSVLRRQGKSWKHITGTGGESSPLMYSYSSGQGSQFSLILRGPALFNPLAS
ncbi:MAG: hypothetical protein CVV27_12160 [Candidatus Melainabacteria bacterium HGW-Melainabacteria-1]|nr:MAG: hypothetical protein CVV27_12160 [Candidatus Melainabacteria bacterium HGW-Melainabacteria-1]